MTDEQISGLQSQRECDMKAVQEQTGHHDGFREDTLGD